MMAPTCPAWHRPVARSLALWHNGGWHTRLVRFAYPALARALDASLDALPPEVNR
jgi:hypothetical protein